LRPYLIVFFQARNSHSFRVKKPCKGEGLTVKVIISEYVGSNEEIILAHRVFLALGTLYVCRRGMCRQHMGPRLDSLGTEEP